MQQAEAAHAAGEDTFTYGLLYQREAELADSSVSSSTPRCANSTRRCAKRGTDVAVLGGAGELACKPDSVPRRRGISNGGAAATIHLDTPLPGASSGLPAGSGEQPSNACAAAPSVRPSWPCFGWGLPSHPVTRNAGALLPHRFTLTTARVAVCFLWHFPASHLGLLLAITLLCEVRTFLDSAPGGPARAAAAQPTRPRRTTVLVASCRGQFNPRARGKSRQVSPLRYAGGPDPGRARLARPARRWSASPVRHGLSVNLVKVGRRRRAPIAITTACRQTRPNVADSGYYQCGCSSSGKSVLAE